MTDLISRADAIDAVVSWTVEDRPHEVMPTDLVDRIKAIPSANAEPKWNCTANFIAEQLDRLRNMTDEEKWEFFKRFFEMKGGDDE